MPRCLLTEPSRLPANFILWRKNPVTCWNETYTEIHANRKSALQNTTRNRTGENYNQLIETMSTELLKNVLKTPCCKYCQKLTPKFGMKSNTYRGTLIINSIKIHLGHHLEVTDSNYFVVIITFNFCYLICPVTFISLLYFYQCDQYLLIYFSR